MSGNPAAPGGGFDAVVLAGGAGRRLGGPGKPGLRVGGKSLLDRVVRACAGAERIVVVGPRQPVAVPVEWAREEPAGGGPVAALGAGLTAVRAPQLLVLAADLPLLSPERVAPLLVALAVADVAVAVDDEHRDQLLLAAWRTEALRAAMPPLPAGARVRDLLAHPTRVARLQLAAGAPVWHDCDTPADLVVAERLLAADPEWDAGAPG